MVDGKQVKRVESEPEKAGVGGSIPSLATIIPKDLRFHPARLRSGKRD
jgi:hypothetical protein